MGRSEQLLRGLEGGWGAFLVHFSFVPLFKLQLRQKSSPGVTNCLLCSYLKSPEQLSALCCLWELKALVSFRSKPCLPLRACKYWLSVRFWLVQSVYPKRCLCWTRKSSLPCGSSYLLIVVDGVLNFILMGNNIKTDQLVRRQKCVQPLQIKPFQ